MWPTIEPRVRRGERLGGRSSGRVELRAAAPVLLMLVSLGTWVGGLFLAWPTYIGMNTATGTVAALSEALLEGRAPGRDGDESLLATYYFPPLPLGIAAARRAGLGVRDAVRAAGTASAVLLLLAVGRAGFVLAGGWSGALLATALLGSTFLFRSSTLGCRTDLLAVAFSLAGLAAWERDREARGWLLPILAAAALLCKLTALTLPAALAWCCLRDGRHAALARFLARCLLVIVAGVALTAPVHGPGWYLDTVRTTLFAPPFTWSFVRGPAELLRYLGSYAEFAVLVALTLVLLVQPAMRATPLAAFAAISAIRAVAALANRGSGYNHLDELAGAAAIGAAMSWVWEPRRSRAWAATALVLVVLAASWRETLPLLRHAHEPESRWTSLTDALRTVGGPLFTEDAMVALAAGRRPAIADPSTLRSLELKGDPRALRTIARLQAGHYDLVVLAEDAEAAGAWYRDGFLGASAVEAIRAAYRKEGVIGGSHFYRPIRADRPPSAP